MKKYEYTPEDGTKEIVTARFTKEELTMIRFALFVYDDEAMNRDNEKTMDDTLRKRAKIIDIKLKKLKGINNRVHSDFVDNFIP